MIRFDLEVEHKPGAVRLDGFPLLAHSPRQWGEGVRTENNGTPVAEIAAAAATESDHGTLAERFGVTPAHVKQALAWQLINGGA